MEVFKSKTDFNNIISEYQILNRTNFKYYLYYIWQDLSKRNNKHEEVEKGISKLVFSQVITN